MHNKKIKAFSLIEIGVVLLVIGILYGAIFKGKDLIDLAKAQSIAQQISHIQQSVQQYMEQYHALPGDDAGAKRFGEHVPIGNADEKIGDNEQQLFWIHLQEAALCEKDISHKSKFGGIYTIEKDNDQTFWLVLSENNQNGLLTPKQAQMIKNKSQNSEDIKILNSKNSQSCLNNNGEPNIQSSTHSCILKIKLLSQH